MEEERHGSRWDLRNGLHGAELRILQRGLAMYIRAYTEMKHDATTPEEKERCQSYVDAAVRLSNRMRRELIPAE